MCGSAPSSFVSSPYEVGKRYPVTEVYGHLYDRVGWWPVMGELHEDADIIGFKPLHYHLDWRFASASQVKHIERYGGRWRPLSYAWYGVPLMLNEQKEPRPAELTARPRNYQTRTRRLKCKREWLPYPHATAPWHERLNAHYAQACLVRGVCPHRGFDLSHEPVVDGIVTCPLHGLRWDVSSGRLWNPPAPRETHFSPTIEVTARV